MSLASWPGKASMVNESRLPAPDPEKDERCSKVRAADSLAYDAAL